MPLIVLFALVASLFAQSQPPSPTPSKSAQNDKSKPRGKQAEASDNNSDSKQVSSAIDKLTSEIASWKKQDSTKHNNADTPTEWWAIGSAAVSALATVVIAVLAFFQWRAMNKQREAMDKQAAYMGEGLTENKRAATAAAEGAAAAKLSAEALIGIERPWIKVKQIYPPPLVPNAIVGFELDIQNLGRTPARIVGTWGKLRLIDEFPIPPDYSTSAAQPDEDDPLYAWVLVPEEQRHFPTPPVRLTDADVADIKTVRMKLIFYGLIKYFDANDRPHETQFCYVYYIPDGREGLPLSEGWRMGGPKEYNYYT